MLKPTKRMAFNFLRSYFDVLNELENDADRLAFLTSIINKQFLNEDPKGLSYISKLCYDSQRHAVEKSVKGWIKASNEDITPPPTLDPPSLIPSPPPLDPPSPPKEEEEKEEVKEEEKVKETLDGKKREKEILTNQAEELYKLYPSQCEVKNRPTGKSSSDKEKLKRLIYTHGFDKVKGSINYYIESSKKSGSFISNFKTLLNNLPEVPEAEELKRNAKKWGQSSGKEEDYSMPKKTKVNYAN